MTPREPRRPVYIKARMRLGAGWSDVLIQNMSSRGLMGRTRRVLAHGTVLEIRRAQHVIVGEVRWSEQDRFGLYTQDPIDIEALVRADGEARSAPAVETDTERRLRPRASPSDTAQRSRVFAGRFQFVALAVVGIPAAVIAGMAVFRALNAPFQAITLALTGH